MFDGKAFGEEVVGIVQDYVERAVAPLKAENAELKKRIEALEARPAPEVIISELPELSEMPELPDIAGMVADAVGKAVNALPEPKDGVGMGGALIDREGHLILTLTNGETRDLGEVVGKDGENGQPGLGFDDMDACVLDDDRTIELSFRRGDEEKAFTFKWPTAIYRGVFSDGTEYAVGDMVTWAGSLWHCDTPTKDKPGTDSWTLAAKKGRDGKDAKVG